MSRVSGQQAHLAVGDRQTRRMWWFEFCQVWWGIGWAVNNPWVKDATPKRVRERGVDFACEECGALAGSFLERGWYRCRKCGYPGQ